MRRIVGILTFLSLLASIGSFLISALPMLPERVTLRFEIADGTTLDSRQMSGSDGIRSRGAPAQVGRLAEADVVAEVAQKWPLIKFCTMIIIVCTIGLTVVHMLRS